LWTKRQDAPVSRNYRDRVFEKFWRRELVIEDPKAIEATLVASGANTTA
jgi:hypothetical protein